MSFWENPFPPLCITNWGWNRLLFDPHHQLFSVCEQRSSSGCWSWPAAYNVSDSDWNNFIVTKPTSRRPSCRTSFLGNLLPHSSNFFCRSVPSLSMTMNLYLVGTESFVSRASERLQLYLLLWGERSCFTLLLIWCFLSSSFQDINTV